MLAAVHDARDAARGHEAVIVSHQLPIWITRLLAREALLPPRPAQAPVHAVLAHVAAPSTATDLRTVSYSEPAGDLIPVRDRKAPFSAGDAPEAHRP